MTHARGVVVVIGLLAGSGCGRSAAAPRPPVVAEPPVAPAPPPPTPALEPAAATPPPEDVGLVTDRCATIAPRVAAITSVPYDTIGLYDREQLIERECRLLSPADQRCLEVAATRTEVGDCFTRTPDPDPPVIEARFADTLEADGALELATVKKVLGRGLGQGCFRTWQPASKDDHRRHAIAFVVGPRGAILQITATPALRADEDACVTATVRSAAFPAAPGVTSVIWRVELRASLRPRPYRRRY